MAFDIGAIQLPTWARWIAQDADGVWWAYEVEPLQFHKGWYENEVGRNFRLAHDLNTSTIHKDWENSLTRVNEPEIQKH